MKCELYSLIRYIGTGRNFHTTKCDMLTRDTHSYRVNALNRF